MCFGDSNTWGFIPGTNRKRFPFEKRIGGIVQKRLGPDWRVIEEGQNGRTTVFEDPIEPYKNGKAALPILLETHRPLDVVTIMLGTNDLKHFFNLGPRDIALGAATLAEMVMASGAGPDGTGPKVLLISPPRVTAEHFAPKFDEAIPKSQGFAEAYRMMADQIGCAFLDAAPLCDAPVPDGVHLDEASIVKLGEAMAEKIAAI